MKDRSPHFIVFALICIFCCIGSKVNAQRNQDVIYLNNGSIYRGKIQEPYSDSIVRILITGNNLIAIRTTDILSITNEKKLYGAPTDSGFYNATEITSLWGEGMFNDAFVGIGFETVNGIYINKYLQTGIGIGVSHISDNNLCIYGDGRYLIMPGRTSPYIYADAGINFLLLGKDEQESRMIDPFPGLMVASGLGLRFRSENGDLAFTLSFGYKMAKYSIISDEEILNYSFTDKYTINRIAMKIGFVF